MHMALSHELSLKGTSARVRIRAKLKHISQRSAIIETNQDSLSNGEWSGRQWPKHAFSTLYRVLFCMSQPIDLIRDLKWFVVLRCTLIFNEGIVASKDISSCLRGCCWLLTILPSHFPPFGQLVNSLFHYDSAYLLTWLYWHALTTYSHESGWSVSLIWFDAHTWRTELNWYSFNHKLRACVDCWLLVLVTCRDDWLTYRPHCFAYRWFLTETHSVLQRWKAIHFVVYSAAIECDSHVSLIHIWWSLVIHDLRAPTRALHLNDLHLLSLLNTLLMLWYWHVLIWTRWFTHTHTYLPSHSLSLSLGHCVITDDC